ncbi:MAG: F0F1 ATP synthase subunit epsilon [Desulfatibacillum sp.]|nr:F0F1 ATP synthase subunit epsilon [Desulfatibacillum sp.]
MIIQVQTPIESLLDQEVTKVRGQSPGGEFCLLPRHIDYATALTPGILSCTLTGGEEVHMAVDMGILVKMGDQVMVSTRNAVVGNLGELEQEVEKLVMEEDERERVNRSSVARLEANFVRRFVSFGKNA